MADRIWRALVVTHRYLGVAIGLLMLMWFVSGIVMMYVGFPRLTEAERQRALVPISWTQCCRFGEQLADTQQVLRAQIEEQNGVPVLRVRRAGRPDMAIDLASGAPMRFDAAAARAIALDAVPRIIGTRAGIAAADTISTDQWTVGRHQRDRPLHRISLDDSAGTTLYVSSTTGQIVLWTTAAQRFWNWIGAVPHWLYFTALREDGRLWTEVVIWTSVVGTFLTVFGLYLGIAQFRGGSNSRISPYRGLFYWHHLTGLVFGILTLTWVVSGLVSMNPWGFLDGRRGGEAAYLQGQAPPWGEIRTSLDAVRARAPATVSLIAAPYGGRLYWLATGGDGRLTRLDAGGAPAPVTDADLAAGAQRIAGDQPIAERGLMAAEDAYYFRRRDYAFARREAFLLPVYRVVLDDAERTRYYLDPNTGALLQRADANGRWHRWLFGGLHRLDFTAWMRVRPLWDIIVLSLMLGGTGVAVTGVYLAIRRIRSDLAVLFRRTPRAAGGDTALPSDAPQGFSGRG